MRILQLANFYHPRSGGLRTSVDAFAAGYAEAGHQVVLAVPGAVPSVEPGPTRTVVTMRAPRLPGSGGYRTIVDRRTVAELVTSLRPDVIELSDKTTLAMIVTSLAPRPPVVLFSHERLDQVVQLRLPDALQRSRLADRWTRRLVGRVDAVVCASSFAAGEMEQHGAHVHRIPLGVDLDTFAPPAACRTGDRARVVYVGRLSLEKCPHDAIDAVHRLHRWGHPVELLVVGDGPMRAELERRAPAGVVRFLGHVADRRVVAEIVGSADVAVAPSPHETFGLAALEALACGTAVATVAEGAIAELITPDTGAVARPGVEGLAAAILEVLGGDRATQRSSARRRAEQFPWARAVDSMLELFVGCLAGRESTAVRSVA